MNERILIKNVNYTKEDGDILLQNVSLALHKKDIYGLIGDNGSGKTTLLKIILKEVNPESGEIKVNGDICYIPQQKEVEDISVKQLLHKVGVTELEFLRLAKGENVFSNVEAILDNRVLNLSGGEFIKTYLLIAKIKNPEILLFDEPTNHLDREGRKVLEDFIRNYTGTAIIVSHDVEFLKENVNGILSIQNREVISFGGTYDEYVTYYNEYLEGIGRQILTLKKEEKKLAIAHRKNQMRHERMTQKGKGMSNEKSVDKFAKGFFSDQSQFAHGKVKKQVERLQGENNTKLEDFQSKLPESLDIRFIFPNTQNKKSLLVKLENEKLQIEDKVILEDINLEVYYGDRVLLSGSNGSGKTLLSKMIIEKNKNLKIATLDQFYEIVDKRKTILENVIAKASDIQIARKILSLYGFSENHIVNKRAEGLSGGEMCRLSLAIITVQPLDMIILDEPTNNIDISTKEVLIQCLNKFKGAILLISHDLDSVKKLQIDRELEIINKKINIKYE